MSGFAALIFSGFTSIRFFGYLVIISIGSCLLGALIVIPAILVRYRPGFIGFKRTKLQKMRKRTFMLAILLPLLQASAQNPDATQVMMKCRDLSITGSMTGKMNLIITEKNGSIRNRTLSMTSKSYGRTRKKTDQIS
jgi:predicted RND superfamily exporter protein